MLHEGRAGIIVLASITCTMLGCSPHVEANPGANEAIRKYEGWLSVLSHPAYGVGSPHSPKDVVFVTDLRATPESGLSRVRLENAPNRIYYVYAHHIDRLFAPVFSDGLAAIDIPVGRWAYIDESGRFAFPPIFRQANAFERGIATAQLAQTADSRVPTPNLTWMLLRKPGSMKALDASIATIHAFSAGLAAFSGRNGLSGYIDRTGATSIPATFTSVRSFCTNGNAAVRIGAAWGLIDQHGRFVIRPAYEDIHCFSEGFAAAKSGKWGFIDSSGKFAVHPRFDEVDEFSEGLARFENRTWPHGPSFPYVSTYGFLDRTGSAVIPPIYTQAYPFKFGIAKVGARRIDWIIYPLSYIVPVDPYYTYWEYIDTRGNIVASVGKQTP